MKIEKGNSYLCLKSYDNLYIKGNLYTSYGNNTLYHERSLHGRVHDSFVSNFSLYKNDKELVTETKPTHYQTKSGYDVIDFCNYNKLNFNRGSALKYIARAGKKDDEIKDLEKAIDFLQREIKFLRDDNK